jgi:hypothetical protein
VAIRSFKQKPIELWDVQTRRLPDTGANQGSPSPYLADLMHLVFCWEESVAVTIGGPDAASV